MEGELLVLHSMTARAKQVLNKSQSPAFF